MLEFKASVPDYMYANIKAYAKNFPNTPKLMFSDALKKTIYQIDSIIKIRAFIKAEQLKVSFNLYSLEAIAFRECPKDYAYEICILRHLENLANTLNREEVFNKFISNIKINKGIAGEIINWDSEARGMVNGFLEKMRDEGMGFIYRNTANDGPYPIFKCLNIIADSIRTLKQKADQFEKDDKYCEINEKLDFLGKKLGVCFKIYDYVMEGSKITFNKTNDIYHEVIYIQDAKEKLYFLYRRSDFEEEKAKAVYGRLHDQIEEFLNSKVPEYEKIVVIEGSDGKGSAIRDMIKEDENLSVTLIEYLSSSNVNEMEMQAIIKYLAIKSAYPNK